MPEMENEQENKMLDIEIEYSREKDELIIALSNDGIRYIKNILEQLIDSEVESHWHIDEFSGWLGGDIKHLIILKKD